MCSLADCNLSIWPLGSTLALPRGMDWPNHYANDTVIITASIALSDVASFLADAYNFECCLRTFPPKSQQEILSTKDSARPLAQRLFVRAVLNHARFCAGETSLFDPFAPLELTAGEFGKPGLLGSVQFNVSSSNDLMAVVVETGGCGPVGIDLSHEVQDAVSPTDFLEQFDGIFTAGEKAQLHEYELLERYVRFNQLWTLKEAFTKFLGCGLFVDLLLFGFGLERRPLGGPCPQNFGSSLDLDWHSATVCHTALPKKFCVPALLLPVYCKLAVLRQSKLPVIVSVVTQETRRFKVWEVDVVALMDSLIARQY